MQPGPAWFRRFKPGLYKPVPPVPAYQAVSGTEALISPLSRSQRQVASLLLTLPRLRLVLHGSGWSRPDLYKPVPVPPARKASAGQAVSPSRLSLSRRRGTRLPLTSLRLTRAPPGLPCSVGFLSRSRGLLLRRRSGFRQAGVSPLRRWHSALRVIRQVRTCRRFLPGTTWLRVFKPYQAKPVPWIPSAPFIGVQGEAKFRACPAGVRGSGKCNIP